METISNEEIINVDSLEISRLGKEKRGSTRAVKIVMGSSDERDKVLSLAPKLKTSGEVWKKVYVKKDLHPVYVKENQRIRKKRNDLITKYKFNREDHDVNITRGELKVDGVTIDKNLFFV